MVREGQWTKQKFCRRGEGGCQGALEKMSRLRKANSVDEPVYLASSIVVGILPDCSYKDKHLSTSSLACSITWKISRSRIKFLHFLQVKLVKN